MSLKGWICWCSHKQNGTVAFHRSQVEKNKGTSPQVLRISNNPPRSQIKYTYEYLWNSKHHGRKHRIALNLHSVKWQETFSPFNRGGPSLISAALFVPQWSGGAYEWVALRDKARKEFGFGMPPAGSSWALAWKEVAEVPGKSPGSETWFGRRLTLVAPVSRNKCSVPGQRTRVMPSLWESFEELAGCSHCWHALALTSLGVSQHDGSQEGSGETRSSCSDPARLHGQQRVCLEEQPLGTQQSKALIWEIPTAPPAHSHAVQGVVWRSWIFLFG